MKVFSSALSNILLALDSIGNLWQEATPGNLTVLKSGLPPGLFMNGTNLFGRLYFGLFDKSGGEDIPRQFDGTNLDRVSQIGPATAPNAADENLTPLTIVASPLGLLPYLNNVLTITETGNIVTATASAALPTQLKVGDFVHVSGVATGGYNGDFQVSAILSTTAFQYVNPNTGLAADNTGALQYAIWKVVTTTNQNFQKGALVLITGAGIAGYNGTWTIRSIDSATQISVVGGLAQDFLGASGGGTVTQAGSITAGLRQLTVAYITRQGFITCPAIPNSWVASGAKRVIATNIAIGPSNIVARLLLFTQVIVAPATTGAFFSLPNGVFGTTFNAMLIPDNVTTTAVFDFTDATLAAGFNGQYLFSQIELGECAAVTDYNSRLVWLRERNKVKADGGGGGFINLTFDGGFPYNGQQFQTPLGWTQDVTAGQRTGLTGAPPNCIWGDGLSITGDGATATPARIFQGAFQDYLGNPIIKAGTAYSVRVRLATDIGNNSGTFHIRLNSPSQGVPAPGLSVALNTLGSGGALVFSETIQALLPASVYTGATPVPADLRLEVYVDNSGGSGILGNTHFVSIDNIEIFPTNTPFNLNLARVSHANNPESFDGLLDQIQVVALGDLGPAGIQGLQASWKIRSNLYFAKDHYLCYVTDDGQNEPSVWPVQEVSDTIGCCGPNAWDGTEEWKIFAERSGMYFTTGSDPIKVVQEIQEDVSGSGKPNWNATNWLAGYTIWARIDKLNKRVLCGLPLNGAIAPNLVFHMDYKFSPSGEAMAGSMAPTYSTFTGRILVHGNARKWSPWNVRANCAVFSERPDGTAQLFFGNGAGTGKIYQAIDASIQGSDDGTAVNDFYQTYGNPSKFEEESLQLGHHWKHVGYLTLKAIGSGFLSILGISPYRTTAIRAMALSLNPVGDFERKVSINGERVFWQVGTNAVGNWFQLERLIPSVKRHPTIPVRGLSA